MGTSIAWMFVVISVALHGSRVSAATCTDTTVVIVGAGASAIGAANKFYEKGMNDFLILEAKDYVGGRFYNQMFADNSFPLGAGWAHVIQTNHSIWKLVRKYNLAVHLDDVNSVIFLNGSTGEKIDHKGASNRFIASMKRVQGMMERREENKESELPLDIALSMNGWKANTDLEDAVELFSSQFNTGIKNFRLGASYADPEGGDVEYIITDKRGFGFILQEESKKFSNKILLKKIVTKVTTNKKSSTYKIDVADGSCYTAESVLITVSSNVLTANVIEFSPPLPDWKMQALSMFPLGHFCKYFLEFDRQFWPTEYYTVLVTNKIDEYVTLQNVKRPTFLPDKNILAVLTYDDYCRKDQLRSDKEVKADILKVLRSAFGSNVPEPVGIMRNFWSIDPFVRGAYSNPAPGVSEQDFIAVKYPVGDIWFAGEHTAGFYNYGYAQGAYDSGNQRAKAMLACMNDSSRCPDDFVRAPICESESEDSIPSKKWL